MDLRPRAHAAAATGAHAGHQRAQVGLRASGLCVRRRMYAAASLPRSASWLAGNAASLFVFARRGSVQASAARGPPLRSTSRHAAARFTGQGIDGLAGCLAATLTFTRCPGDGAALRNPRRDGSRDGLAAVIAKSPKPEAGLPIVAPPDTASSPGYTDLFLFRNFLCLT